MDQQTQQPMGLGQAIAQPPAQPQDSGGNQATPEEQDMLHKTVAVAYEMIYRPDTLPTFLEMLKGGGDPAKGLAQATVQTVARIQQSAEQAGDKIPGDVLFAAGKEILEDLADLATKAGIHDFAADEDALDGAFFQAVDDYRMLLQEGGKLNPQDYAGEMQKLQEMDASGDFERTLRSAAEQQAVPAAKDKPMGLGAATA